MTPFCFCIVFHGRSDPGDEMVQPTFVGHRWLIKDKESGEPLEAFISTRSAIRDRGTAQIALIR